MSKRKIKSPAQQQPLVEQLAELQIYIDAIKSLATRLNRPVANLLTFITGLGFAHRLISPLLYSAKEKALALSATFIYPNSELSKHFQLPKLLESILFFFADLVVRSAGVASTLLHGTVENVQQKQLAMQSYESILIEEVKAVCSSRAQEGSITPETEETVLRIILQTWRSKYQDPDAMIKFHISILNNMLIDIECYLLVYIMLLSASKYIVSPLLLRVFPHGVVYPLKLLYSLRKDQVLLSANEIVEAINEQRVIKNNLEINRKKITALSRITALVGLLVAYSLDDSPPLYSTYKFVEKFLSCDQMMSLVPLALFSTALDSIFDDLYQCYLEFNREKRMRVVEKSLNALSHELGLSDWENKKYRDDSSACYFYLVISRRDINKKQRADQELAISRLVKELVCVLYHYEPIKYYCLQ